MSEETALQKPAHAFSADGERLCLAVEARRISFAHLFDSYKGIHSSLIRLLPHQITAVYEEMLPRQPLRFLLADDPGAGKTIMTGLLVKELIARGALERCLVVAPGNLAEHWQDELMEKFGLEFGALQPGSNAGSAIGNPFEKGNFLIAKLDTLARNPKLMEILRLAKEWDLVVCDEAHRMSADLLGQGSQADFAGTNRSRPAHRQRTHLCLASGISRTRTRKCRECLSEQAGNARISA